MSGEAMFLVWSNEHGAWWGPARRGYTLDYRAAGRYSHGAAAEIAEQAIQGGPHNLGAVHVPPEVIVLAPEHRWQGGAPDPFTRTAVGVTTLGVRMRFRLFCSLHDLDLYPKPHSAHPGRAILVRHGDGSYCADLEHFACPNPSRTPASCHAFWIVAAISTQDVAS